MTKKSPHFHHRPYLIKSTFPHSRLFHFDLLPQNLQFPLIMVALERAVFHPDECLRILLNPQNLCKIQERPKEKRERSQPVIYWVAVPGELQQ